jgi:hypothetical protein
MGLSLAELTQVHDTFHDVILGQLSTPIGLIDLEVSCGSGDNKCMEMLTFEVKSFDIGYNYILRIPFLLKFMVVIHTTYATQDARSDGRNHHQGGSVRRASMQELFSVAH